VLDRPTREDPADGGRHAEPLPTPTPTPTSTSAATPGRTPSPTPGPVPAGPATTPQVEQALQRLRGLALRPPADVSTGPAGSTGAPAGTVPVGPELVAAYDEVHRLLQDALATLDEV
jgi:hypothetical protein